MYEFTLEVELESGLVEIVVDVDGSFVNDGIGHFECWGTKGHHTQKQFEIHTWEWDKTGYSKDDRKLIESAIEDHVNGWAEDIERNYG